jgi:serine/threonine protein phosphatase PrpC
LGRLRGVVIAEPDVKSFRISSKYDFIGIASDGVFDKLSNSDVVKAVWSGFDASSMTFYGAVGDGVKRVLEEALDRRSLDNVTAVLVAFKPMQDAFTVTIEPKLCDRAIVLISLAVRGRRRSTTCGDKEGWLITYRSCDGNTIPTTADRRPAHAPNNK